MKASRPPIRRILETHRRLSAGATLPLAEIASGHEVDPRTVYRDLAFMRDQLGAPIEFDRANGGYRYVAGGFALPPVRVTEGEILALFVADRVVAQYQGTPFVRDLDTAFRKLTTLLPDDLTVGPAALAEALSVRVSAPAPTEIVAFRAIQTAVLDRRRLRVVYLTPGRPSKSSRRLRTIDPYHMRAVDGRWYLHAFDHRRRKVLTFAVDRFERVEETEAFFRRPHGFDAQALGVRAFRAWSGSRPVRVRLAFDRRAAPFVKGRVWHPSQAIADRHDGGVDLQMTVAGLREVTSWVLSWGARVRIVAPAALRRAVVGEARALLSNHGSDGAASSAVREDESHG